MKKYLLSTLCVICLIFTMTACSSGAQKSNEKANTSEETKELKETNTVEVDYEIVAPTEDVDEGQILLPIEKANYTKGVGIGPAGEKIDTVYDKDWGMILGLAEQSEVEYIVPENVKGNYDIYLRVSKNLAGFGSTPFTFAINEGDVFAVPMNIQIPVNAPESSIAEDASYYSGTMCDTGRFLVKQAVELKAGDTITVMASHGSRSGALPGVVFPNIGSVLLAPSESEVATGYSNTVEATEIVDVSDPLSGVNIVWLGSSVTYGAYAGQFYSMADAIADNHAATICEKYAVSATTLVNNGPNSYVSRLKEVAKDKKPDAVVVQLSTNDATTGKPYGEMSDSKEPTSFDDTTIIGAIESIIAYTEETFSCPVIFYTGTYYESEEYAKMVECLHQIQDKWDIGVIDMFNNDDMKDIYGTDLYEEYMFDEIHPNRKGYTEWWTPVIESSLKEILTSM